MKILNTYFSALILVLTVCLTNAHAEEIELSSSEVEAAYLVNLFDFVRWPEEKKDAKTTICVVGGDAVLDALHLLTGYSNNFSRIEVSKKNYNSSFKGCTIVYIDKGMGKKLEVILFKLKNSPALTVSNAKNFLEIGGIVQFDEWDNRLRIKVDAVNARANRIEISALLHEISERTYIASRVFGAR